MPKKTFLNLPEAKRKRFIQAALTEFSFNDYKRASISKIVKKLGIAKGSFYQYFENKKDLYFYLVELCANRKKSYVMPLMQQDFTDFWAMYEAMYLAGIQFDLENPLHSGFLYSMMKEQSNDELMAWMTEQQKQSIAHFKQLLQKEKEAGRLRTDISIEAIAFHLVQLSHGLLDLLSLKYNIDYRKRVLQQDPIFINHKEEVMETARQMLDIMKHGVVEK